MDTLIIDREQIGGYLLLGLVFTILIFGAITAIQKFIHSLYSIPKNKEDQLFTVEEVKESNRGKPVPCANEYNIHYLLHIKVTWRGYSKTVLAHELQDDATNDGTQSYYTRHFLTKESADNEALRLSQEAQGLIIDESMTVVNLS
jgi:hypothetical protein